MSTEPGSLHSNSYCELQNRQALRRPVEPKQYTSIRYTERLAEAGIQPSVGSVGDSYDNAMAEALNGTYKAELIDLHGPWKTRQDAEIATIEWMDWYRTARLHSSIGHVPPAEREEAWYRQNRPASTAGSN